MEKADTAQALPHRLTRDFLPHLFLRPHQVLHPRRVPPPPPPPTSTPPPPPPSETPVADGSFLVGGGFVGGTLGYNWQVVSWVFGLEGDYAWANISGSSSTCGITPPHSCGAKLELFGTFRGRIGYALGSTGTWLPYITGGLAVGEVQASDALTPSSGQAFRAGWTVGAGIETLLAPNWTAKVEYLYMDLGSAQLFDVVPGVSETVSFKASLIRGGINYKLSGTDAPRAFVTK